MIFQRIIYFCSSNKDQHLRGHVVLLVLLDSKLIAKSDIFSLVTEVTLNHGTSL